MAQRHTDLRHRCVLCVCALLLVTTSGVTCKPLGMNWGLGFGIVQPTAGLADNFRTGPQITLSAGTSLGTVQPRISITYASLRGSEFSSVTNHGSVALDAQIPQLFGFPSITLIGGAGAGARKLSEGRVVRSGRDTDLSIGGVNEPLYCLVGRLGLGMRVYDTGRWRVSIEAIYHSAFSIVTPESIGPDTIPDEMILFSLVLSTSPRAAHP